MSNLQIELRPTGVDGIYHYEFASKLSLTKTLLRFQEHYESPSEIFRSRPFTLGEYRKWYASVNGDFTYYTDWAGFNIPSYIFKPSLEGDFDPLDAREQQSLDLIREIKDDKFYVIATYKHTHSSTIEHEIVHGIYYLNPEYRRKVLNRLKKYDNSKLKEFLLSVGYSEPVLDDECNAYLATKNDDYLEHKKVIFSPELRKELMELKDKYYPT